MYSDDEGTTWKQSQNYITITDKTKWLWYGANEPGVVELANGQLLMFIRTDLGYTYKSMSYDSGITWSTSEPILPLPTTSSPSLIKRIPGTNDLLAIYNEFSDGQPLYARNKLAIAISNNNGETFQKKKNIEHNTNIYYDFAYPSFTFQNNNLIVSYYYRNRNVSNIELSFINLKVVRIPLDWIFE